MTKTMLDIIGTILVVLGIAGFVSPGLGGTHLSTAHNLIHIVTGALALWFGLKGTVSGARTFSWVFGVVYGLLGVAGLVFGQPGVPALMGNMGSDPKLLTVIPNVLELGRNDHMLHVLLGVVLIATALMARPVRRHVAEEAPPVR